MRIRNDKITLAPTDLANFLSCRHLTSLDLSAAVQSGEKRPARFGPMLDALRERGIAHEQAYLEKLRSSGLIISEPGEEGKFVHSAKNARSNAMKSGDDVIFQASLVG